MSRQNTPRRMPVPSAFAQASLAAKRLAKVGAGSTRRALLVALESLCYASDIA
jgi:hypothetical protein